MRVSRSVFDGTKRVVSHQPIDACILARIKPNFRMRATSSGLPLFRSSSSSLNLFHTTRSLTFPGFVFYSSRHLSTSNSKEENDDGRKQFIIKVPRDKISLHFSRSSGPGGQNVNKVNTKAEIRFSVRGADWLPDEVKERFRVQRAGDINKDDECVVTSSVHRTQHKNIEEAFNKLQRYVDAACIEPKKRIPTEVPKYAIEKRLEEKKKRSEVKKNRKINFTDY
jgi:hypothetical protein